MGIGQQNLGVRTKEWVDEVRGESMQPNTCSDNPNGAECEICSYRSQMCFWGWGEPIFSTMGITEVDVWGLNTGDDQFVDVTKAEKKCFG